MSQCNFCKWKHMKRQGYRKATQGERKKLWPKRKNDVCNGGVVIVDRRGEFSTWFMELPDHCCC